MSIRDSTNTTVPPTDSTGTTTHPFVIYLKNADNILSHTSYVVNFTVSHDKVVLHVNQ